MPNVVENVVQFRAGRIVPSCGQASLSDRGAVMRKSRLFSVSLILIVLLPAIVRGQSSNFSKAKSPSTVLNQVAELTASDGEQYFRVGWSVCISGNTIGVGATGAFAGSNDEAYVFVSDTNGWQDATQTAVLSLVDPSGQELGQSIACTESTIVLGTPAPGTFQVDAQDFVYTSSPSGWIDETPTAVLNFPSRYGQALGYSVAIDPTSSLIFGGANAAVAIYEEPSGGWKNSNGDPTWTLWPGGSAGAVESVAESNETLVVGSPYPSSVSVYAEKGHNLRLQALLSASDGANLDYFGDSVAISGDTIVVGAPEHNNGVGAVYIFVKPSTGWANMTQTAELTSSDAIPNGQFGTSVAINGKLAIAGAPGSIDNPVQGAAYAYVEPAGGWINMSETYKLLPSDAQSQDMFGNSISISGNTAVVGAPLHPVRGNVDEGAAYVFVPQ